MVTGPKFSGMYEGAATAATEFRPTDTEATFIRGAHRIVKDQSTTVSPQGVRLNPPGEQGYAGPLARASGSNEVTRAET